MVVLVSPGRHPSLTTEAQIVALALSAQYSVGGGDGGSGGEGGGGDGGKLGGGGGAGGGRGGSLGGGGLGRKHSANEG